MYNECWKCLYSCYYFFLFLLQSVYSKEDDDDQLSIRCLSNLSNDLFKKLPFYLDIFKSFTSYILHLRFLHFVFYFSEVKLIVSLTFLRQLDLNCCVCIESTRHCESMLECSLLFSIAFMYFLIVFSVTYKKQKRKAG